MIPEHRLAVLLDQLKQSQVSKCLYHNPSRAPSLFTDHICDRSQFPLQTLVELSQNDGEVWCLEFSHNGKQLAAAGSDTAVVIYDTTNFQMQRLLRNHDMGIAHLSWSPDDSRLITCSQDKTAKVWDVAVGSLSLSFPYISLILPIGRDLCCEHQSSQPRCDCGCLGT